jgi:AbrB family looped-hinge helix DNA binding protein
MGRETSEMEAYVTVKGQIVIPIRLRRKFDIRKGTKIVFTEKADGILLKPVTEQYLRKLQGALKGRGSLRALVEDRRSEKVKEQT